MLPLLLQGAELNAPAVVGTPQMREASIWVQTTEPADVRLAYWPKGDTAARRVTEPVRTSAAKAHAAILRTAALNPGQTYAYEVLINDKAVASDYPLQFTTAPMFRGYAPAPDFTVAVGGGHYVNDSPFDPLNRTPGGGYEVFLSILSQSPQLMLWAGNNVHLREADYGSRAGIIDRYSKSRTPVEMAPLLSTVPNAAVWGARDYGEASAGKYFRNAKTSREIFELFWPNPETVTSTLANSFTYGDAEFFLLDVNSARDTAGSAPVVRTFLGPEQTDWLLKQLRLSKAKFKVVIAGASLLNPAEDADSSAAAPNEREKLLRDLLAAGVRGLLFVSGGKDYGELTKVVRPNAPALYELSVGPLTHRPGQDARALNYFREPSTATFERQFALLRFHGPEDARKVDMEVRNTKGDLIWSRTLGPDELGN